MGSPNSPLGILPDGLVPVRDPRLRVEPNLGRPGYLEIWVALVFSRVDSATSEPQWEVRADAIHLSVGNWEVPTPYWPSRRFPPALVARLLDVEQLLRPRWPFLSSILLLLAWDGESTSLSCYDVYPISADADDEAPARYIRGDILLPAIARIFSIWRTPPGLRERTFPHQRGVDCHLSLYGTMSRSAWV